MIINTLYKTDTIIDGIKYNSPSEINNYGHSIKLIWKNENGPAYIEYNGNGNITKQEYWENGIRIK